MNSTQWLRQQDAQDAGTSRWFCYLPASHSSAAAAAAAPNCALLLRAPPEVLFPPPLSLPLFPSLARLLSSLERVVVCSGSVNVKFDSHLGMHVLYSRVWSGVQQGGERGESTQICCAYVHWSLLPFPFLALSLLLTYSAQLCSSLSSCVCIQDDCIIFAG